MSDLSRTHRLGRLLLVSFLTMASMLTLFEPLCVNMGHAMVRNWSHVSDEPRPSDSCPDHPVVPDSEDAPADAGAACCAIVATLPVETAAVVTSPGPAGVTLSASVLPEWTPSAQVRPVPSGPPDAGPPPSSVRTHLAISILLI